MDWQTARNVMIGVALGVVFGIGGFTFIYARGYSYLTNDPAACANCHVMREQFDGWVKSSHRSVATCNDCHTPHDALGKYYTKARNGFWHSFHFTVGGFHEPIRIGEHNHEVCFQVEEVEDWSRWHSVMLTGRAERLTAPDDTERAMQLISARNPTLASAINRTKIGHWTRLSHVALFRVRGEALYGRKTV